MGSGRGEYGTRNLHLAAQMIDAGAIASKAQFLRYSQSLILLLEPIELLQLITSDTS